MLEIWIKDNVDLYYKFDSRKTVLILFYDFYLKLLHSLNSPSTKLQTSVNIPIR